MSETGEQASSLVLDAKWYARLGESASLEAYVYLRGDPQERAAQEQAFLAGEITNPQLAYPKLKPADLSVREEQLLGLKADILKEEPNETVAQAYRWKINEKIALLRMLQAAGAGDMKRFKRYSEFIYGRPSAAIFAFTVDHLRQQINTCLEVSQDPAARQAAQNLEAVLPKNLPAPKIDTLPNEDEVAGAREITLAEFGDLVNLAPTEGNLGVAEVTQIAEQALELYKAEGWQVVPAKSFSVVQEERKVEVRATEKGRLAPLLVHEIGTHLLRRLKGERSKLMLLGLGLDRYNRGDEGVATMREQVMEEKMTDFSGLAGHLAISLAVGLDGQPRDFRQVFEVMEKYYLFQGSAKEEAREKAYDRCLRTFRGTDCQTPGTCFTGDIDYREGNIGVWEVIKQDPKAMLKFSLGKYDPANQRHVGVLTQLGITEEDLEKLH